MVNKTDCIVCNKGISRLKKGVNCSSCTNVFHTSCGQIPDSVFKAIENGTSDWRCTSCRGKVGRKSMVLVNSDDNDAEDIVIDQSNLNTTIKKLSENMNSLRLNYIASMESMNTMNQQLMDLQNIVTTVNEHDKKIKTLVKENHSLNTAIKILTLRLDNMEQSNQRNKLQLNGIPVTEGEDLHSIVINIASKMNINLSNDDFIEILRNRQSLSKQISDDKYTSGNVDTSSSSIVVPPNNISDVINKDKKVFSSIFITFKSFKKRNEILSGFRNLHKNELFFDNDKKFKLYFNEYLSSNRRRLFTRAKLFAKQNDVKFVWIQNGNILLKRKEGERVVRINSQTDFSSIFETGAATDLE